MEAGHRFGRSNFNPQSAGKSLFQYPANMDAECCLLSAESCLRWRCSPCFCLPFDSTGATVFPWKRLIGRDILSVVAKLRHHSLSDGETMLMTTVVLILYENRGES